MNLDPRSVQGELSRGKNNYGGLPAAPGAGRPAQPASLGGLNIDMETIRRKMIENASQHPTG